MIEMRGTNQHESTTRRPAGGGFQVPQRNPSPPRHRQHPRPVRAKPHGRHPRLPLMVQRGPRLRGLQVVCVTHWAWAGRQVVELHRVASVACGQALLVGVPRDAGQGGWTVFWRS